METNMLVHGACIKAVQVLHYILVHSKDDILIQRSREMIDIIHQREILPTIENITNHLPRKAIEL